MIRNACLLLGSLLSSTLFAYPEMVRDGYANCTACHVSPNGGGILTAYGRGLSGELMSTWTKEGETDFLYGLVHPPSWLNLGGDVRAIQTYRDTPQARDARFIFMQADLEAAATLEKWVVDATFGRQELSVPHPFADNFISRRHFVIYHPKEPWFFRAGKFQKQFGINIDNHVAVTKRGLGWDEGTETYNVEASYLGDTWDGFATAVLGRPDSPSLNREKGLALSSSVTLSEHFKTGVSYFYGASDAGHRHVFGPFGILGFSKSLFALIELDFQNSSPSGSSSSPFGFVNYIRLDYELVQGLHGFLTQEISRLDLKSAASSTSYGLGVQFFPRPHFEISGIWQKVRDTHFSNDWVDYAWLLLHFYP